MDSVTLDALKKDRENVLAQMHAISGVLNYINGKIQEIERTKAAAEQEEKTRAMKRKDAQEK